MNATYQTLDQHLGTQPALQSSDQARSTALVIRSLAAVASTIADELAHAALRGRLGAAGGTNVTGDQVKKLDVWGHDVVVDALRRSGACAALVSEESPEPVEMPEGKGPRGVVVACDPVDGSSNLDVNGTVGTIFSIKPSQGWDPAGPAALTPGTEQLAAGYVMYGTGVVLVYTAGQGTHGFTMERKSGTFYLTHPNIRVPKKGKVYGINEGNMATWHPGQRAFVEHLKTSDKATGRPYSLRYSGAMVADIHRTILDGGLFMYPADMSDPTKPKGKLRLLYEVAPMGMVVEQAGGRASTGTERVLELKATDYHQRAAIIV